jgi:hypothetical protein
VAIPTVISNGGRGSSSSKNHNVLKNLDGDKFYMKIGDFVEIYNFVVQNFFI